MTFSILSPSAEALSDWLPQMAAASRTASAQVPADAVVASKRSITLVKD
jgi:hypothetical protein